MSEWRAVFEGDNASVYCLNCDRHTAGMARGMYEFQDEKSNIPFHIRYVFVECNRCSEPFVVMRHTDGPPRVEADWGPADQLYPSVDEPLPSTVPAEIADAYREAKACFRGKSYQATAVMCRRAMDLICHHLGEKKGTLEEKLLVLKKQGDLEERTFNWANEVLRPTGNQGAHGWVPVSREDAQDAVEFTRAIIEYLFMFVLAFDRFQARHPKKPSGA